MDSYENKNYGIFHNMTVEEFDNKKEEILRCLENTIYGQWRSGEKVNYEINDGGSVRIIVEKEGVKSSFTVNYYIPKETPKTEGGYPFWICMHNIPSMESGLKKGHAFLVINSLEVASDDYNHKGCFYDIYPYSTDRNSQTGVLAAWAWGASKVLDAVLKGLGKELNLNSSLSLVTGVSRWGKAVSVLGAFDHRFRMVIPACSGAGGLALYSHKSTGTVYDFSKIGGPADYTYGENEPLSCLQSDAEKGWFVDEFLEYKSIEDLPFDQDVLPKLAIDENSAYFIVAAHMNEDWVNAPSMWECYKRAYEYFKEKGMEDRLFTNFHPSGHAVIDEDMEVITRNFERLFIK